MPAPKVAKQPAQPFQLSLHIRHPSIDPLEISRELQVEADESFGAGQPRKSETAVTAATSLHRESYWVATLDVTFLRRSSESLGPVLAGSFVSALAAATSVNRTAEAFIGVTCARLISRNSDFLRRLREEGGSVSLVAVVTGGERFAFRLRPELSRHLAELGITLDIELSGD